MNLADPLCLDNIKTCCAASRLAYSQPSITDSVSGESVLIQDRGDCTVIAFPGTHDLRDVLRDIDCLRVVTVILGEVCSVHAGFNRAHNALIAKIISACSVEGTATTSTADAVSPSLRGSPGTKRLSFFGNLAGGEVAGQRELPSCKTWGQGSALFVTGHSKGATVARRCALALLEKNFPVAGLITFGEPRGGDARYAAICNRALAGRSLRITNAADPVPWLPAWLAGNRHCGPEGWLPPCSGVSMSAADGHRPPLQLIRGPRLWCQLLLNSAEIFRAWRLKNLAPLADHHIDNYLGRIDAL